jgi:hypothetical protein
MERERERKKKENGKRKRTERERERKKKENGKRKRGGKVAYILLKWGTAVLCPYKCLPGDPGLRALPLAR